jgi:DNA-binding transcriptional regulator YiaG
MYHLSTGAGDEPEAQRACALHRFSAEAAQKVLNGAYLRARREARNLSLRNVARLAHLSAAFLSDVENNRRNASDRALLAYVYAGIIDSSMLR